MRSTDKTTGTNTTGTDDNTALTLSKLRVLQNTASDHADSAAATYEDEHAKSLWHAGQAFLCAAEATRLAATHDERWGDHDNAASDARSSAQLAAAATEGAWEGE